MMDDTRKRAPRLLWVNATAVAPYSGGGTRHFELARELVRRGWDVTIGASDFNFQTRSFSFRAHNQDRRTLTEAIDGVFFRWHWAAPYSQNDWRRVQNWVSFAQTLIRDSEGEPDVIIGSSPHLFAALAAFRLASKRRVPFILEVRDLWPESLQVRPGRRGVGYFGLSLIANFLYRRARAVIVLAQGVGDYLIERGVPRERIIFAPNGAFVPAFVEPRDPTRTSLRLLYAGAHGPANGLDVVLAAADLLRGLPQVKFTLVGDGPDKPRLQEAAIDRRLTNVEFLSPVSKREIPRLMSQCDAGLMVLRDVPLFRFGVSPNKLFDYWGSGLPVINNVGGEVAGLVAASGGGLTTTDATGASLADGVHRLLALGAAERTAMGERGRTWIATNRDRQIVAAPLDRALRHVARLP